MCARPPSEANWRPLAGSTSHFIASLGWDNAPESLKNLAVEHSGNSFRRTDSATTAGRVYARRQLCTCRRARKELSTACSLEARPRTPESRLLDRHQLEWQQLLVVLIQTAKRTMWEPRWHVKQPESSQMRRLAFNSRAIESCCAKCSSQCIAIVEAI
jgi:hypothetical protein